MDWPIRIVRYVIAFAVAYVVTYVLAAFFYTLLVNAELASLDAVDVPLSAYITGTWDNIVGLNHSIFAVFWGAYTGVILIGLLIAYAVALGAKEYLTWDKPLAVALVGAAVLSVAIGAAYYWLVEASAAQAAIAFVVTAVIVLAAAFARAAVVPLLVKIAYPTAGAAAIGVTLYAIGWAQGAAAMAGARDVGGFILQMAAGAIGGVVFALLRPVVHEDAPAPATA